MKAKIIVVLSFCFLNSFGQKFTTPEEVIEKYLEVTKIKANAATINDMVFSYTSESPRGVAETEIKIQFPFKYNMSVFSNGMELFSTIYDGEKLLRKSNWGGGNQEPKTGPAAKNEAFRSHPFVEMEYKNLGYTTTLLGTESADGKEYYIIEVKDADGKSWKDYYNVATGFKDKTWIKMETPRGSMESTSVNESYKAFKGTEILFPATRKQIGQMGETVSELQSVKINKGLKPKDFEIK